MKKLLIHYNFILVTILVLVGFLGVTSIPQLLSAVVFFPLAIYFWLQVIPRRKEALIIPGRVLVIPDAVPTGKQKLASPADGFTEPEEGKAEDGRPSFDINRRTFIKILGSAGLALFFLTIFTKKPPETLFGSPSNADALSLKNPEGTIIDPSQKHPTDGYTISRVDDSTPAYYGFVNKDGAWFVMQEDFDGAYKYAKGASDFVATGWNNRNTLKYAEFNEVFE